MWSKLIRVRRATGSWDNYKWPAARLSNRVAWQLWHWLSVRRVSLKSRPWSSWWPVEQATIAYGQGISVSLLQIARAYTIFTNEGRLLPLSLLKRDSQPICKPLISARTAREMTGMMEMVVEQGGTAPLAQVPGYRVAGKTGTALKPVNGRYAEGKYVSSFVGFAPVSDPDGNMVTFVESIAG